MFFFCAPKKCTAPKRDHCVGGKEKKIRESAGNAWQMEHTTTIVVN